MEFDIDVRNGIGGHIEITDYSKEYGQYYDESSAGGTTINKYKYSQSNSLNVIIKVDSDKATLMDVLLDLHDSEDKELLAFDVKKDGYYTVTHYVLPTKAWLIALNAQPTVLLPNFSQVYYIDNSKIMKCNITTETNLETSAVTVTISNAEEVTIKELLERNIEGTTIQKCQIDIFYTGYLQECYINYCRELFNKLMANCRPDCKPKDASNAQYARDFLWMTLNVIDYLIGFNQYLEAQRILEEINYCGGFCNNVNTEHGVSCGCNTRPKGCGCK